ncbi:MAG: hypothetical protein K2Q07_10815 [Burkholderiaceae bacterium]|nr:hypothetical protein [Burkholderiaceae bacterium]
MIDIKRLSVDDATPGRGPFKRPWLDSAVVRFAAAIALVALCYGLVVLALPAP